MRLTIGLIASTVLTPLLVLTALPPTSAQAAGLTATVPTSTAPSARASAAGADAKPQVGACYALTTEQLGKRTTSVDPIPCRRPHTTVTAGVPNLPPQLSYRSTERAILSGSVQACARSFAKTVGGTFTQRATARYFLNFFRPTEDQIGHGARWVRCDVVLLQGAGVGPLPLVRQPFLKRGVTERIRRCGTRSLTYVSCRGGHGYRAVGAFRVARRDYPTQQEFKDCLDRGCRRFLGRSTGYATIRNEDTWDTGDRTITCFRRTKT